MLSINDVSYSIAGNSILESVSFQISASQHVGLFGRNGSGKSTLFKLILGELEADAGKIQIENCARVATVRQDLPNLDMTVRNFVISQDTERLQLLEKLETGSEDEICEVYDKLLQIDAFGAEARAAKLLRGMGFSEAEQNMSISEFSGGFRMRIALCAALYSRPDLLLLDEPTNHLDLETTEWLQTYLKSYPGSFILISHDRDFLNNTVEYVAHLKNKQIKMYSGNFEAFLENYTNAQKNAKAYNAKMAAKKEHMLEYVRRFGAKATKAKQAQSRLKAIEKLHFIPVDQDDHTVAFDFPEPMEIPSPILTFNKIFLGYAEKTVLKNISGSIMNDDKIAIVGENGNGKTTFAKFLAGELKQKKGTIDKSSKLNIGFYRQDMLEKLNPEMNAIECLEFSKLPEPEIRSHLGRFGICGDAVFNKIKSLSGGEKARLVFSILTITRPNMLILDEPTNHLDMEMRESLIDTLMSYKGTILCISHDRNFLNRIANSIIIVRDEGISYFNGDIDQYEFEINKKRS